MGDIKPLPEAIRNSLRSAIILFDMTRVVEELIFNSLDAGATKISVAVGAETCYLKVADNGCGITRDGLVLLAERYASSKFNELADSHAVARSFGFRGEALSSIASVSLLEVLTKSQGRPNAYRKVMKGCKCLYVGIDDGRQDVGTTVIVRDLFYNQPVRRKLIHSSPKKVLESVKKCVLRISLVRPNVSFKVVNIESDDELFCASSSSSPLSKLMSGFGVEVANSLHEMNVTAGSVKLSGYMSSPCDISSAKAFQYVYINSRYISKGTIHKLLNQLASSIRYLQHPKVNVVSQTAKRSRCQTCCTFILNLCCPRSWYDITFEPSKTSVEFKDWKPIIGFIEKAITRFWSEIVSHGDTLSAGAGAGAGVHVRTDNVEIQAARTSSPGEDLPAKFRADKRKNRVHNHASPIAFPSHSLKMPSQKDDHVDCPKENAISCHATTYQRDSFFKTFDESPSMSGIAVDQEFGSCDWEPDYNVFSNEDQLVENKFLVPEKIKKQVDYFSKSGFDEEHLKVDARLTKGHLKTDVLGDPFEIGNVDNMSNDFGKSFLQSCTSWKRRDLEEDSQMISEGLGASLTNNYLKSDLPIDSFKNGNVDSMSNDSGKPFPQSCTSWKRRALDEDSQMLSEGLDASLTKEYLKSDLPIDSFENGDVDNISNDFGKPFLQSCTSRKKRCLDEKSFTRSEALEFPIENLRCKRTNRLPELNFSSKAPVKSSLSGGVLHRQNDFLVETNSDFRSRSHGFDDFDENPWRGYEEYDSLAERGFMDLNHFDDIVWNTSSRDYFSSFSRVDSCSNFKKYAHTEEDNFVFHPQHSLFDVTFPRSSDRFIDETKRLSSDFCGKYGDYSCAITSPHKFANDKDQNSIKESFWKTRPRRSHSAPPFHRGRKKAFVLNNHLAGEAEKAKKQSVDLVTSQEAGKLKHLKRSSALCPLDSESNSMKDLLVDTRESKKGPGTCGVEKVTMKEKSEGLHFNCMTLVEDIQDPVVPELKWRDYSKTANGDKTRNPQNEETILDVSSGLLHLAGDLLVPKSNSRNFLNGAKVLQQVDKKFIPVVGNGVLAVIDQHAADERIRLEELRQKVLAGEKKTITYLDVEQKLVMPEMGYQLLYTHAEQIQNWGWLCDFHSQDSRSFKKNLSFLHKERRGITLTAVPCVLGVNLTDVDLLEFLQQLADTDGSSTIPPSVHRVLNSKACRGAIMFGDTLLPSECSLIVEELKQTSLCFQCAHGRPTTVPLINLKALHKQIEKLGSCNKNSGTWHGLRRHIPSLERATDRLSSNEVQCS